MKEKHVFLTSLFYIIGGAILVLFMIAASVVMLYAIIVAQDNPTIKYAYIIFGISVFGAILFVYVFGNKFFQWVIIDKNRIRSRNIFKTILEAQWKDIKEVVLVMFNLSGAGTAVKWLVLKDKDEDIKQYNGVMNKDTFITIRYSKRAVRVIRIYWKDKITNLDDRS